MLRETPEIETAFALADALFLSSRLDPLPNVVIDALTVGLPVLCFDRATGAAEILAQHGLHAECVANYLDTSDVAQKIRTLAASDETYAAVASRSRDLAATTFDFGAYVDKIEHIALQTPVRSPDLKGADDGLQKIV